MKLGPANIEEESAKHMGLSLRVQYPVAQPLFSCHHLRLQYEFNAFVRMIVKGVIRVMRLIERHFMRDDLRRIELACHNFLIQHRHVMDHGRLSHG